MGIMVFRSGGSAMRSVVAVSALALLAGCMENDGALFRADPAAGASGTSTRLVERDVEAPEVFQATEAGLWDGRPSLGGVWVAHPDVVEPERALIRNTTNGKFVIGALFRPSLDRPGPRFQVSSDAAEALSMLAGQPQNLNVTALRREEVPTAPEPAPAETAPVATASVEAEDIPAPAEVETATLDPVAPADTVAEAPVEAAVDPAPEAEPKKRRWFWQKKDPVVEETALAADVAPAPVPEVTSAPVAQPAAAAVSTLDKPYLQIGIFSVEQNARNTAVAMRQSGIIPEVLKQSSKGKTFWRVIVGPATNAEERAVLLKKVKAAGFTDAYAVTN